MKKTKQELCNQVATILYSLPFVEFGPTDSNQYMVLTELQRVLPNQNDIADNIIVGLIQQMIRKGQLGKDVELFERIQDLQQSPQGQLVRWHQATTNQVLDACRGDYSEAGLSYALGLVFDHLEKSAYQKQLEANERQAEKDAQDLIDLRAEMLAVFEKQKPMYMRNGGAVVWLHALKAETKRVEGMDIDALRAWKSKRTGVQQAAAEAEAARTTLHNGTPQTSIGEMAGAKEKIGADTEGYAQFPRLPKDFFPRGSFTPILVNKAFLDNIARQDPEWMRQWYQKYGSEQIEARRRESI